jgi:hypothetical protein
MGKQPEFDADGYQSSIRQINNEPLPGNEAKRLSPKEQQQLGIPDPEAVLQALRSWGPRPDAYYNVSQFCLHAARLIIGITLLTYVSRRLRSDHATHPQNGGFRQLA